MSGESHISCTNLLGFSLSGSIMEAQPSSDQVSNSLAPLSCFTGIHYEVEGENAGFNSPLIVMPLKSDGSLCVVEAMNRGMALSLDSMYYNQPINAHDYNNLEYSHLPEFNLQWPAVMPNWVTRSYQDGHKMSEESAAQMGGYSDLHTLSLSMSPGSQSSCVNVNGTQKAIMENKKRGPLDPNKIAQRKSMDTFGQRTSRYRGVTRHRWTGRYEAHLWDNSCKKEGQSRKGRQVYLGGYDMEEKAARAYDLAALKYWGPSTHINFPVENYEQQLEEMKNMSRQEFVAHLRRRSSGFSRGASIYRGVTRHHQHGRWQARIGRVAGNKDLYLGTFSTQEDAAEAYDVAAIKFRGLGAVTNFDMSKYDVERIMESDALLSGEMARRRNVDVNFSEECSENNTGLPDWRIALYHHHNITAHASMGIEAISSDHDGKFSGQLSNASSLVTSLNSSREGSPERNNEQSLGGLLMPQLGSNFLPVPTIPASTWIPAGHLFPGWGDGS